MTGSRIWSLNCYTARRCARASMRGLFRRRRRSTTYGRWQRDWRWLTRAASRTAISSPKFVKPSWSPDGRQLLIVVGETVGVEKVHAVDVESGALKSVSASWAVIRSVEWVCHGASFIVSATPTFGENAQLWEVRLSTQERRRVTNDVNAYSRVSMSADGSTLLTVHSQVRATLWIVPGKGAPRPLVESQRDDGVHGLAWSSNGRIVFQSNRTDTRQLWSVQPDGTDPRQLTDGGEGGGFPSVSKDGRHIVYARKTPESIEIWRAAFDGTPHSRLVAAGGFPVVCNDGWVYYSPLDNSMSALRVRSEGGSSESSFKHHFMVTDCLPNGDLLGYIWDVASKRAAVARMRSGGELQVLGRIPVAGQMRGLKATPDGNGISLLSPVGGRMEIWMTTWEQTPPVRLTQSGTEQVFAYAWSPDGLQLVVSRGRSEDDVVLLQRK